MITAEINPGACGLLTVVNVTTDPDKQKVFLELASECPNLQEAAEELKELEAYREVFGPPCGTRVYEIMSKHTRHPSCPVPAGVLRAIEVAVGISGPHDVNISVRSS